MARQYFSESDVKIHPLPTHYLFVNLTGQTFNRLFVIGYAGKIWKYKTHGWWCRCICHNIIRTAGNKIVSGHTSSCGCFNKDMVSKTHSIHNTRHSPDKSMEVYSIWTNIKTRCYNSNNPNFKNYGKRGIKVCNLWKYSYIYFKNDIGIRPSENHSIDRIDNNGNYSCGHCSECVRNNWSFNVRWATPFQQGNNRRETIYLTSNNVTKTISEWSLELNIPRETMKTRYERGYCHPCILRPRGPKRHPGCSHS